jgi:hypothetical protein
MDRQAHSGRHGIVGLLLFGMFIASYRLRKVLGVIALVVLVGSGLGYFVAAAIGYHDVRAWAVLGVFRGGAGSCLGSGVDIGLATQSRGFGLTFGRPVKLNPKQRRMVAERYAKGETMAELARDFKVSEPTIWRVLGGKTKVKPAAMPALTITGMP